MLELPSVICHFFQIPAVLFVLCLNCCDIFLQLLSTCFSPAKIVLFLPAFFSEKPDFLNLVFSLYYVCHVYIFLFGFQ